MIWVGGHIQTSLGKGFETNLKAILAGEGGGEPVRRMATDDDFVTRCVQSVMCACGDRLSPTDKETVVILSSTKGDQLDLWTPATELCRRTGNPNPPIVVSNACTSGVCAQIVAARLIESGKYKAAIVTGCDIITEFIRSGFDVLKALSANPCKPFDAERDGINLGEAVATMVVADETWCKERHPEPSMYWQYQAGSIHNDANHITGPSRTGEGSYRCLSDVLTNVSVEEISMIGLHGTGTLYNDEMESIALHRAGLSGTAANSLKGYFGHTLGAAGLLETMLCLYALEQGLILPTKGFERQGTTYPVSVSADVRKTEPRESMQFVKLLSGFGGTNAAVRYKRCNQ